MKHKLIQSSFKKPVKIIEENHGLPINTTDMTKWTIEGYKNLVKKIQSEKEKSTDKLSKSESSRNNTLTAQQLLSMDIGEKIDYLKTKKLREN